MNVRRIALLAVVVSATACQTSTFGESIGRPTYNAIVRPDLLTLAEVYFSDPQASERFAVLVNTTAQDIDGLTLQSPLGSASVPAPVPHDGELAVSLEKIDGTGLWGDELAAVDGAGVVRAYLAWGSDPTLVGSQLAAAAVVSGATQPGAFVPASYPLPPNTAIVSVSAGEGCATAQASVAALGAITPCPITP